MVHVPVGSPVLETARSIVFFPLKSPFASTSSVVITTMNRLLSGS